MGAAALRQQSNAWGTRGAPKVCQLSDDGLRLEVPLRLKLVALDVVARLLGLGGCRNLRGQARWEVETARVRVTGRGVAAGMLCHATPGPAHAGAAEVSGEAAPTQQGAVQSSSHSGADAAPPCPAPWLSPPPTFAVLASPPPGVFAPVVPGVTGTSTAGAAGRSAKLPCVRCASVGAAPPAAAASSVLRCFLPAAPPPPPASSSPSSVFTPAAATGASGSSFTSSFTVPAATAAAAPAAAPPPSALPPCLAFLCTGDAAARRCATGTSSRPLRRYSSTSCSMSSCTGTAVGTRGRGVFESGAAAATARGSATTALIASTGASNNRRPSPAKPAPAPTLAALTPAMEASRSGMGKPGWSM